MTRKDWGLLIVFVVLVLALVLALIVILGPLLRNQLLIWTHTQ